MLTLNVESAGSCGSSSCDEGDIICNSVVPNASKMGAMWNVQSKTYRVVLLTSSCTQIWFCVWLLLVCVALTSLANATHPERQCSGRLITAGCMP